jgi:hypothetical protein
VSFGFDELMQHGSRGTNRGQKRANTRSTILKSDGLKAIERLLLEAGEVP